MCFLLGISLPGRYPKGNTWQCINFPSVLSSRHHSTNAPFSYVIRLPPTLYFHGSTALEDLGLLIEVSRPDSDTSHQVGLLRVSDRPVAETST